MIGKLGRGFSRPPHREEFFEGGNHGDVPETGFISGAGFMESTLRRRDTSVKEVSEISIDESAIICGLIRSPNRLSPFNNFGGVDKGAKIVF